MIGRRSRLKTKTEEVEPKGFDDFDLRLGDLMRGERATLGKSLLDVERDLRIKAGYISAIENAEPDAFDTPGFIPGYVRSYARYLNMDPDKAFRKFCAESGFSIAHGMSAEASSVRKTDTAAARKSCHADPLLSSSTPFLPASEGFLARIEPGAIGSVAVLVALIGALGYGGYSVLNEIQRVQMAPVENTPDVLADLDPLAGMGVQTEDVVSPDVASRIVAPSEESFDRLYRPAALDVPVMVARDAPIATLNPARVGAFAEAFSRDDTDQDSSSASAIDSALAEALSPQVLADTPPGVTLVAVRPAWVRVRAADGTSIFEGILNAGDTYEVPVTEKPSTLRVGESGAIYFAVNGQHYGPAGPSGSVTSNLALSTEALVETYEIADLKRDQDLQRFVAELQTVVTGAQ